MSYSYKKYKADGASGNFGFDFSYIDKSYIEVYANGVKVPFTFLGTNTIQISPIPVKDVEIEIRRATDKAKRLVDFSDGSVLDEKSLDLADEQVFNIVQEAWDRSDVVIAKADAALAAVEDSKKYAGLAYKYERQANDHMDNARDADDRARIFSALAEESSKEVAIHSQAVEAGRLEVSTNAALVKQKADEVSFASAQLTAKAGALEATVTNAQTVATQANNAATAAQATVASIQPAINAAQAASAILTSQQSAILSARDVTIAAKDTAVSANASAVIARDQAVAAKDLAVSSKDSALSSAASALASKEAAEAAAAQVAAASPTGKADITYVDAQIATRASATGTYSKTATDALLTPKADITYVDAQIATRASTANTYSKTEVDGLLTPKANLSSPTFTGVPTVPTAAADTATTQVASTAYVVNQGYLKWTDAATQYAPKANPAFTGVASLVGVKYSKADLAANDINLQLGTWFAKTISAATTFTVSNIPATGSVAVFHLILINGGSSTITWMSGVKWGGGTVPTLTAAGKDHLSFYTYDGGTTWTGMLVKKDIK